MNSLKTHIESDTSRYVEVHGINIRFNDAGQGEVSNNCMANGRTLNV